MALTVRELVEIPRLATAVHAGRLGIDREVRFACPCEMPSPWEWLSSGDLLLTSGIGLPDSPAAQAEYVRRLAAAGLSGVSIGAENLPLSAELIRSADRHNLPILITAYEVPWVAVSRAVSEATARDRQVRLVRIERIYDKVREIVPRDGAGDEVFAVLGEELDCVLSLRDVADGRLLLGGDEEAPGPAAETQSAFLLALDDRREELPAVLEVIRAGGATAVGVPIPSSRPAYLMAEPKRRAAPPEADLLRHIATVAALELERLERRRTEHRQLGAELFTELLDAPMDATSMQYRLVAHGLNSSRQVLAGWGPAGELEAVVLQDALERAALPHLMLQRSGTIFTLLDEKPPLETFRAALPDAARVGVSAPFGRPLEAGDALRQAAWALQAAEGGDSWFVQYGDDHPPFLPRTLTEARAVVDQLLGPLLAYDEQHGTELLQTLRVFLQCNRSWKRTSEALFLHKQSLVYRVRRVEEVTGRNLNDTEHVAELWFALRALQLSSHFSAGPRRLSRAP
ncbi:MAG: PucR family transcriptional regulator ligand-binding domain-containing protein [Actinobacteria bacterium]|nr:PucR family transcriptional regulator ligand-binding domain-containing protein [Actinomycetota bacterium]